jgi:hypothetical protein
VPDPPAPVDAAPPATPPLPELPAPPGVPAEPPVPPAPVEEPQPIAPAISNEAHQVPVLRTKVDELDIGHLPDKPDRVSLGLPSTGVNAPRKGRLAG